MAFQLEFVAVFAAEYQTENKCMGNAQNFVLDCEKFRRGTGR
jgi:hypothetical protein